MGGQRSSRSPRLFVHIRTIVHQLHRGVTGVRARRGETYELGEDEVEEKDVEVSQQSVEDSQLWW